MSAISRIGSYLVSISITQVVSYPAVLCADTLLPYVCRRILPTSSEQDQSELWRMNLQVPPFDTNNKRGATRTTSHFRTLRASIHTYRDGQTWSGRDLGRSRVVYRLWG